MKNINHTETHQNNRINERPHVLMITPFHKQMRGNAVTAARICSGLEELGWRVDLHSLEEGQNAHHLSHEAASGNYGMIHGFHALHMSAFFDDNPELMKLPFLLTMTGTDLFSLRLDKNVDRIAAILDLAAAIVVFNADEISLLNKICPDWSGKTTLIPQGVALKDGPPLTRNKLDLLENDVVFVLPSGLRAIKNIDMAVDALDIVKNRNYKARLLIVGIAIEMEYAIRLIDRIALNPDIAYLGPFDHADMKSLLQLTDVVVNCSHSEGQPQAALEAMSLGKPCILTAVPGNLNVIENYREGIYVQTTEELAAAMEYYIKEPEQRAAMGRAAQKLIDEKFTLSTEISSYHKLYEQLTKTPPIT